MFRRPFTALDGVNLEVREGDFFALLGQNGAGKSTAMHCFLGLLRPSSGRVDVLGCRPEPGAPFFAHVGYLPEEPRYHEYLSVEEAVTYYARLSGIRLPQPRVSALLEQFGLAEHRALRIRRCSKGMKQKVGIIQSIIHEPRLLFLDEPMRGLDPITVHLFRDMLVDMHRKGTTIVMNSHLLAEVELVATRVAIIERGRVVAQDEVSTLLRGDRSRYAIEVESAGAPPPHLENVKQVDGRLTGMLPADDLYAFMDHARVNNLRIVSCALEKQTLEESFVSIVRGGRSDA
jgi:ABC-2 type transport system ATP-binding protein